MILRGPLRPDLLRAETLPDLLRATAGRLPGKTALIWRDRFISYGELLSSAEQVAAGLSRRQVRPGQVVGLWLPRGADLLIAQAGIALHGAAWLPFDADTPPERIANCLASAGAAGLVTRRADLKTLHGAGLRAWAYEDLLLAADQGPTGCPARPSDPAYVIYTSGSTGQPKGIVITHRSICHLLRAENDVLGVRETDRVYQGFSVAFDMSFEEIWMSYLVGATLWIAPPEVVGDPEALARALDEHAITVVHAVPTLMGLIDAPLPGVRLINLGGEACPAALVDRLTRPGRRLFNTYGPTETSVTATLTTLTPGEPVTIGHPLANYGVMIVDEERRLVAPGEIGELAIFGPGLAAGYLGREDLTAAKFVPNPHSADPAESTIYLTGDLARIEPAGPIHCLGRVDDQVKIRGFRVELGEIESRLVDIPGVGAAAVVLRQVADVEQLVGFVVPAPGNAHGPVEWRQALTTKLPPYMVPARLEQLTELPRLPSGKVDRARLRALPLAASAAAPGTEPANEDERVLFAALTKLLPGQDLRPEADFFRDLGGHSLLAARLVSLLRHTPRYATLAVGDLYRDRTLGTLARTMARIRAQAGPAERRPRSPVDVSRHFLCGLGQALCLPFLVLWHISSWLAPFFTYHFLTGEPGDSLPFAVGAALTVFVLFELVSFAIAIGGKRLLAGNLQPGRYPLWGATYFRYWLSEKLASLAPLRLIHGTGWLNLYLRCLGARIGRDVFIDSLVIGAPALLSIGDEADLGSAVLIANVRVEGGFLVVGRVTIGPGALVESNTVLEGDVELGAGATLEAMSTAPAGTRVPARQTWAGSPPRRSERLREVPPPRPAVSVVRRAALLAFFAAATLLIAGLFFLPVFPTFMLIDALDVRYLDIFEAEGMGSLAAFGFFFLLALPASLVLVGATILLTAGLRRLLVARQVVGRWAIHGGAYCRKWLVNRALDASLETLHGLYASVFAATWLRLMGARVGANTEISTATGVIPDLLRLGRDAFVADGVMLGDETQRGGWMTLRPTSVGDRSFLGNGAYVGDGTDVPADVLIGVQTRTPPNEAMTPGQVWLGSPALLLPAREGVPGFDPRLTFRPSRARWLARATIESLRIVLPLAFVIAAGYLVVRETIGYAEEEAWAELSGALAAAGCLYAVASFLLVVALKWTLVGRYRPTARPMWSPFVWLSEAVTCVYESLAVPNFLEFLRGTPLLPWALRLLGARIGARVFLDTTDLTEFDCVAIGEESELNALCGPQTHLFEDRVMKIGQVRLGRRVAVGPATTILYDTEVGDDVRLGPLTLVAKGERLPAGTDWTGSPAAPCR